MNGPAVTTITTVGEGHASGTPDTLRLHVTVTHRAGSVSDALSGCASRLEAAVEVARSFTEPARIGSTGLHVDRFHDGYGQATSDWVASHSLRVECPDLGAAGDLVTALAETVGDDLRIGHVEMFLAEPGGLAVEARGQAFADARAKAEELAELAGQQVLGVLAVAEGGGMRPLGGPEYAMAAADTRTSFEPGSATVSAVLTVTWQTVTWQTAAGQPGRQG